MLDVRPTQYLSPADEQPLAAITPEVHVENLADEGAYCSGLFRIYRRTTGLLVYSSALVTTYISGYSNADIEAQTPFTPPEAAVDDYYILLDLAAFNPVFPHTEYEQLGGFNFDVTPPEPPPPEPELQDVIDAINTRSTEETLDNVLHLLPLEPALEPTLEEIRDKLSSDPATNAALLALIDQTQLLSLEETQQDVNDKLGGGLPAALGPSGGLKVDPAGQTFEFHTHVPSQRESLGKLDVGTSAQEIVFALKTRVIHIQADSENTGQILVGSDYVSPDGASALASLAPGDSIALEYDDSTNPIFVCASIPAQHIIAGATTEP